MNIYHVSSFLFILILLSQPFREPEYAEQNMREHSLMLEPAFYVIRQFVNIFQVLYVTVDSPRDQNDRHQVQSEYYQENQSADNEHD